MLFRLIDVTNRHTITESKNHDFLCLIQSAGLCALKEFGYMTDEQYHYGYNLLKTSLPQEKLGVNSAKLQ